MLVNTFFIAKYTYNTPLSPSLPALHTKPFGTVIMFDGWWFAFCYG